VGPQATDNGSDGRHTQLPSGCDVFAVPLARHLLKVIVKLIVQGRLPTSARRGWSHALP
jgi:hypothetical protein